MYAILTKRWLAAAAIVAVASGLLFAVPAKAAERQAADLTCSVPQSVMLGEPLMLECRVSNQTDVAIHTDFGWDRAGAFTMELKAPGQEPVRVQPGRDVGHRSP